MRLEPGPTEATRLNSEPRHTVGRNFGSTEVGKSGQKRVVKKRNLLQTKNRRDEKSIKTAMFRNRNSWGG